MIQAHGLSAAHERSRAFDRSIQQVADRLDTPDVSFAIVGLGSYGRREPTPHGDVDVLFLHSGTLDPQVVTRDVCYPLWEQHIRLEPIVRTVTECAADARRSLAAATRLLDARLIAGDDRIFAELKRHTVDPLRRDRTQLLRRLRPDVEHRHLTHAAVTSATAPDIIVGRGGLEDARVLCWLERLDMLASETPVDVMRSKRLELALDFLLAVLAALEELTGHRAVHLNPRSAQRVAERLGCSNAGEFMWSLRAHARWTAFHVDNQFAPVRHDRPLGAHLELNRGRLVGTRMPSLDEVPGIGLRVA
ncbi:MAG: hypothetical protein JOY61_12200, partial [Chloroflexi bacterium]|nr:hypothetical protein [Chloroflexota bacterium]